MRVVLLLILLTQAVPLIADSGSNELNVRQTFQIRAGIVKGCLLGSGATDATSFGSLSFGQFGTLPADVNRVTTVGSGSIVLQCTPGMALTVGLSSGASNTSVSSGRLLFKGSETLRYQLYQNAGYSTVWGDGSNGATLMSITFPGGGTSQTYPVYARLLSTVTMPSAGIYSDVVTVTITY